MGSVEAESTVKVFPKAEEEERGERGRRRRPRAADLNLLRKMNLIQTDESF